MSTGCGTSGGTSSEISSQTSIEIRFHDGDGPPPQGITSVLRLTDAAPAEHDKVVDSFMTKASLRMRFRSQNKSNFR